MHRRPAILASLLLALAAPTFAAPVLAQTDALPQRPVQIIIPFPPGGNTDLMARALQQELSQALGQPVVATNRGGAAGAIGNGELARARADGGTIGLSPNNALTTQPFLQNAPYRLENLRVLCGVYDNPQVVILARNAPFRDFAGMIAYARTGPEALVFATPGVGSTQHILTAQMLRAAGVSGLNVPFAGAGPITQAALGGQVMMFVESAAVATAAGLPVLAVLGEQRLASLPEVPSTAELGVPMAAATTYGGLLAPAAIPDAAAAAIERGCERAVRSEAFTRTAERLGGVAVFTPGAALRARLEAEAEANQALLRELGIARE